MCNVHDCSTGGSQSSGGVDLINYGGDPTYILQGSFGYGGDAAGNHGGGEYIFHSFIFLPSFCFSSAKVLYTIDAVSQEVEGATMEVRAVIQMAVVDHLLSTQAVL